MKSYAPYISILNYTDLTIALFSFYFFCLDVCDISPCINGGSCQNNLNLAAGFVCICLPGYTGQNCQTGRDEWFVLNLLLFSFSPSKCLDVVFFIFSDVNVIACLTWIIAIISKISISPCCVIYHTHTYLNNFITCLWINIFISKQNKYLWNIM